MKKNKYDFPQHGEVIEADSYEEACKKLDKKNTQKKSFERETSDSPIKEDKNKKKSTKSITQY